MKPTDEQVLKELTGRSISEFRQDLLAFGNQIIQQQNKSVVEQAPPEVQVSDATVLLTRTPFL